MGIDVEALSGAVTIYRERRSGVYKVQPMCRYGRLGLADAGEPVAIEASDEAALMERLGRSLDDFASNRLETSTTVRHTPKEQSQFVRSHDAVMVVRLKDGRIEAIPWEHDHGGYKAKSAASLVLDPPVSAAALASAIREAFGRTG